LQASCAIIPNHHSISDFRKNRIHRGLKKKLLFKLCFFPVLTLIGCKIIAIDGNKKSRAHNSKKANNQKKIDEGRARKRTKTTK
jgi:ketopantoate reductase